MPGRGKGNGKPPIAERIAARRASIAPITPPIAPVVMRALLNDQKIERAIQDENWREIKRRHHGDPPVHLHWNNLHDRRVSVITASSRVCCTAGRGCRV